MSDVTVAQFAEVLKVPVDRLLVQLESAGIQVAGPQALISDEAKLELLTQAIASEETLECGMPADDLLLLEGMKPDLALALARRGVRTREDLADQAVDDLLDIEGLSADEAGKLIMKAREIWFEAGRA